MKHLEDGRGLFSAVQETPLLVVLLGTGAQTHQWSLNEDRKSYLPEAGLNSFPYIATAMH